MSIEENVPLAPFTSFGIGGPARYLVRPHTEEELKAALSYAKQRGLGYYLLGGGTNILVSDKGFDGLVIKLELNSISIEGGTITAQAGAELARVIDVAAENGLSGIECLAGIPGTLGGAVRGNAGAFGTVIGDLVADVVALDGDSMKVATYTRERTASFEYRSSMFKKNRRLVVVSARLALSVGREDEIREKMKQTLEKRVVFMENERSVGSYFINPKPDDEDLIRKFEDDRKVQCRNCMIPAGWFIDQAGLRGLRIGDAMVSEKHGNYLINAGGATADDVIKLATMIKQVVREKMGIELQEEVNYVGF